MSTTNLPTHSPQNSHSSLPTSYCSLLGSRKFILQFILLFTSLLVFCISLFFAIHHWRHQQTKSLPRWTSHSCRLISNSLQQNPSNSSQFRITAQVTVPSFSQQLLIAYYGPTSNYNLSRQQAQNALTTIHTNTTCYLSTETPPHVSLLALPSAQPRPSSVYIAWTATFVAAVMALIQLTILSHVLHKCIGSRFPPPSPHLATPHQVKTPLLTSRQTNFICKNYAHDLHRAEADNWVCSICLDDHSNESVVQSVRLPCQHSYHQRCIREWLSKGKSFCPLCNWNVKSIFENTPVDRENNAAHVVLAVGTEEDLSADDGPEAIRNTSRSS